MPNALIDTSEQEQNGAFSVSPEAIDYANNINRLLEDKRRLEEISKIKGILSKNSKKNFVKRILQPQESLRLDLGQGRYATHLMSWGTTDGRAIVYPNVVEVKPGKLKQLSPDEAWNYALKNKEFIEFDNQNDAEWFSQNYKKYWYKLGVQY